jgi:4-hydroxy-tetrahydrodipicolinate reductase
MIHVAVNGALGRTGSRVIALLRDAGNCSLAGALEKRDHPDIGRDVGEILGLGHLGVDLGADIPDRAEVLIDFSLPEGSLERLEECVRRGIPMIIGTTGFDETARATIRAASKKIPLLLSSNMSVGANLMRKLAVLAVGSLGDDCEIEIVEAHHRFKRDAPSGTALMLADALASARDKTLEETAVYGRKGITGPRAPGEIAIHAIRLGDIVGEHSVLFGTPGERLEIAHTVYSRDAFASGALMATRFILGASPGLYTMESVMR